LPEFDPFLLLDEFGSDRPGDYLAGFPEHPHRGFETVTYMLAGRMRHRDNAGNSGLLTAGSVQLMTAGRGILHSEMPEHQDGLLRGFQLWVNLPAKDKMTQPRYQDIAPERIPEVVRNGVRVRVIAGRFDGVEGPVQAVATEPAYYDVALENSAQCVVPLAPTHNAFVYPYEGTVDVGAGDGVRRIPRGELAVLTPGDRVVLHAIDGPTRALVVAGRPLGEPISRYGPIVMNTRDEVARAFADLRDGTF
jgi:quercetin 2,3-dioxygenase